MPVKSALARFVRLGSFGGAERRAENAPREACVRSTQWTRLVPALFGIVVLLAVGLAEVAEGREVVGGVGGRAGGRVGAAAALPAAEKRAAIAVIGNLDHQRRFLGL